MYEVICSRWREQNNKACIVTEDSSYTFSWIQNEINLFESFISRNLLKKQEPQIVLLIGDNSIFSIIIMLYCARKNILCAPVSPSLTEEQLATQERIIKPNIVIKKSNKKAIEQSVFTSTYIYKCDKDAYMIELRNLEQSCREEDKFTKSEPAFLLTTTSGSTGSPKPVSFSQKTKLIRANAAISYWGINSNDVIMNASPIHSSLGQRLSLTSLIAGATCILLRKFNETRWVSLAKIFKLTFTIPVTSHIEILNSNSEFWNIIGAQRFKGLVSSSSFLSETLKKKLIDKLGSKFYEMYGASEIGTATILDGSVETSKASSVGKALPGVTVKIIDEEGHLVKNMEVGEIAVKTPCIFTGYYQLKEKTSEAFRDNFFLTGDLGHKDNDDFLYFKGRTKDIVKSGGYTIYCSDVEDCIQLLEYVRHCKAISADDTRLGNVIVAFVELKENLSISDSEKFARQIRGFCAKNMAPYQVPQKIIILANMPRLRNDKVDLQALRSWKY